MSKKGKKALLSDECSSNKSVSGSMLYLIQVAITSVLPLISIPIITHQLKPEEYGIFALGQVYALVAIGIANWGVSTGYERNYFLYEKDNAKSGALLNTVTGFVALNTALLMLFVWIWKDDISVLIFDAKDYGLLLFFLLIGMGLSSLANYYLTYLKNVGHVTHYITIMIIQSILNFSFLLLFLLYFDMGLFSLVYAFLLSNIIMFIVTSILQFTRLPISLNITMLWDVLKISLPLTPRIFFGFLGTQFDKMMLGMMASLGGVGIYTIGQKVASVIFQFMTALDRVFIPEVYRRFFEQEAKCANLNIGKYLNPFAYISIAFAMLFVLFSEELFAILMPESYASGVDIVIVLSLYYASMFFGKITGTQLIYAKKTYITTWLTLFGIILNVLLNIPMIIQWGAIGAAWATMLAGVLVNIVSYRIAQRYAFVDWDLKALVWMYGLFIISAAVMLILRSGEEVDIVWVMLVKSLFVISYLYVGSRIRIVTIENVKLLYTEASMLLSKKG